MAPTRPTSVLAGLRACHSDVATPLPLLASVMSPLLFAWTVTRCYCLRRQAHHLLLLLLLFALPSPPLLFAALTSAVCLDATAATACLAVYASRCHSALPLSLRAPAVTPSLSHTLSAASPRCSNCTNACQTGIRQCTNGRADTTVNRLASK